jgi:hypothetical protein
MSAPRIQSGYVFEAHGAWHIRFTVHENGKRKQRSYKLCNKDSDHLTKDAPAVIELAKAFMEKINLANVFNDGQVGHCCPYCGNRCKRTIEQKFATKV